VFRDGVVVKTVVHRVVVFIDLMKRFCSFVFFVVFSRSSIGSKISSKLYRHKLVVVVLNSLLTGLIQSSLSLCVYIRARAKEKKLLLLLLKEDIRDTKGGKVYSSSSSFNSNCVLRCDGVDVKTFSLSKRFHFHHRTERE
jgi:hypothetical protein